MCISSTDMYDKQLEQVCKSIQCISVMLKVSLYSLYRYYKTYNKTFTLSTSFQLLYKVVRSTHLTYTLTRDNLFAFILKLFLISFVLLFVWNQATKALFSKDSSKMEYQTQVKEKFKCSNENVCNKIDDISKSNFHMGICGI